MTSDLVVAEFRAAPPAKAKHLESFFADVLVLPRPEGFDQVVREYINQKIMPEDASGDAAHLAMSSMESVDFLLTWNCRHLANANKWQHIRVINARLGLHTPTIVTPFELVPE